MPERHHELDPVDAISQIPARDGLFARLKYCPACRDEIKRAEQDQAARRKFRRESELHKKRLAERAREREENLKLENEMTKEREKAPKNERQQIEYSRMMAECNSLAETSEKRTLEERGFDTGG